MKTSIEISYYPLNKEYKDPIKNFIESLKQNENIAIKSNSMSTQVYGDFDDVMSAVTKSIKMHLSYQNQYLY